MHFSYEKIATIKELEALFSKANQPIDMNFVAVEGLVFDENYNWILMRRGPGCRDEQFKLEGIGGRVENDRDFIPALQRELKEEAGESAVIDIVDLLEIRTDTVHDSRLDKTVTWVIVSFICVYKSGDLEICEPTKNLGFEKFQLTDIKVTELSSSTKVAYKTLKANWEQVKKCISEGFNDD